MKNVRFALFLFWLMAGLSSASAQKRKVLFLSSYSINDSISLYEIRGFKQAIDEKSIDVIYEFMDSRRFYSKKNVNFFYEYILNKLNNIEKLDCIVTADDAALEFMLNKPELRGNTPLVFLGIQNTSLVNTCKSLDFVTGIVENYDYEGNINLLKKLFPSTKDILVIIDSSRQGVFDSNSIQRCASLYNTYRWKIVNMSNCTRDELNRQIKRMGKNSAIFICDMYLDDSGNLTSIFSEADWVASIANCPIFGIPFDFTGNGILGGVIYNCEEASKQAGILVHRILNGEDVSTIPIIENTPTETVIDKKVLHSFGVSIANIPLQTRVVNSYENIFERDWIFTIIFSTILIFLIIFLLLLIRQSRERGILLATDDHIFRQTALKTSDFIAILNISDRIATLRNGAWYDGKSKFLTDMKKVDYESLVQLVSKFFISNEKQEKFIQTLNLENIIKNLKENENFVVAFDYNYPEGLVKSKQISFSYLSRSKGIILFYRIDLTKSISEEKKRNNKIEAALKAEQESNLAKSQFVSRISHDIRTPIGAILNLTDFAKKDINSKDALKDDLEKIATSGRFLLSLINDVLDISKINSEKIELKMEPYALHDYMSEIKNIIGPMCLEKNISYTVSYGIDDKHSSSLTLILDKVRLNQITLNLLSNSVKYTPKDGSIWFYISTQELENNQAMLTFQIKDNGIGMSKSFQKNMFNEFSQETDNPLREKSEGGTGLGLTIVKKLVELMKGEIYVQSGIGLGTNIKISIPAQIYTGPALSISNRRQGKDYNKKLEGTILLAEDNEINAIIAKRIFEEMGLKVDLADNGAQEVDKFIKSEENYYTAVFTDIQMPIMDGYDATETIRGLDREDAKKIPIIAITANAFSDAEQKAAKCGMTGFTTKPLDPDKIREILLDHSYKNQAVS